MSRSDAPLLASRSEPPSADRRSRDDRYVYDDSLPLALNTPPRRKEAGASAVGGGTGSTIARCGRFALPIAALGVPLR